MNLSDLRTLLDYHYWARDRVLDAVDGLTPEQFTKDLGTSFGSVQGTLVHLYSAEWIWCSRWQGGSPTSTLPANFFSDVPSLRTAWVDQEAKVRGVVDELGDAGVAKVFEYRMLNGQPASSPFWHMLQHMVNHGSYHRGQVTTLLRQLGAAPAKSMDLIAFHRQNART